MSDAPHPLLRFAPHVPLDVLITEPNAESEAADAAEVARCAGQAAAQVSAPAEVLRQLLRDPERKGLSDEAIVAALGALAICDAIKDNRAPRGVAAPQPPMGISRG